MQQKLSSAEVTREQPPHEQQPPAHGQGMRSFTPPAAAQTCASGAQWAGAQPIAAQGASRANGSSRARAGNKGSVKVPPPPAPPLLLAQSVTPFALLPSQDLLKAFEPGPDEAPFSWRGGRNTRPIMPQPAGFSPPSLPTTRSHTSGTAAPLQGAPARSPLGGAETLPLPAGTVKVAANVAVMQLAEALGSAECAEELKAIFRTLDCDTDGRISSVEWGRGVGKHQRLMSKYFGGTRRWWETTPTSSEPGGMPYPDASFARLGAHRTLRALLRFEA